MKKRKLSKCPWPYNTDCICRSGVNCGGFDWSDGAPLGMCPYYQQLKTVDVNRIETRVMNECRNCKKFNRNDCKESECKIMVTLCYLEELKTKVKPRGLSQGSHIVKTISGSTYHGKDYNK